MSFVSVVLSGRGLCDELITRPEESYRLWCVVVCNLENLKNDEAMTRVVVAAPQKKKVKFTLPVPVATRSKALVCGRSLADIVGSNPTGGMNVCLL